MTTPALLPTVMLFGRYKDVPVSEVPLDYLVWLAKQRLWDDTRAMIEAELGRREDAQARTGRRFQPRQRRGTA